jgi:hypothetical protein
VKVVNLVEEWRVFEEYIGEKLEFCPLLDCEEKMEAQASSGKAGFPKEFEPARPKNVTQKRMRCGQAWI